MGRSTRRNIFSGDGYREISANEEAMKTPSKASMHPIVMKRKEKEKEIHKLMKEEAKWKKRSVRADKTIVPKGTGKRG